MKVSEIKVDDVKEYLHVYHNEDDNLISAILLAAKAYVRSYTGQTSEGLDNASDLAIAVLIICADMYDNRTYTVETNGINPVIETILNMHSVNLL